MELNNELKLLLIKTGIHKDDAAAQGLFDRIKDNDDAWSSRLSNFYKENSDVGTIDSDGKWTEPSVEELKAKLIEKEFVQTSPPAIWEMEGYENETAWTAQEYARNRAAEYPSIADQLDEIYHNGIDAWKAKIKETKDKYPKG
tara:strand:+ start:2340 stop:2768 length:429 start_codon:yes stop_codon:yes gene_type:complete